MSWLTSKAAASGEFSEWQMFKRALDWDGFVDFWQEAAVDAKNTIKTTIEMTATDFWDNLTGKDKLAESDEALKRMRSFNRIYREKNPALPPPDRSTRALRVEEEFKEDLASRFSEEVGQNPNQPPTTYEERGIELQRLDDWSDEKQSEVLTERTPGEIAMDEEVALRPPYARQGDTWTQRQSIEIDPIDLARDPKLVDRFYEITEADYTAGAMPIDAPELDDAFEHGLDQHNEWKEFNNEVDEFLEDMDEFGLHEPDMDFSNEFMQNPETTDLPNFLVQNEADLNLQILQDIEILDENARFLRTGGAAAALQLNQMNSAEQDENIVRELGGLGEMDELGEVLEAGAAEARAASWGRPALMAASLIPGLIAWGYNTFKTRPSGKDVGRIGYVSHMVEGNVIAQLPCYVIREPRNKSWFIAYKNFYQFPLTVEVLKTRVQLLSAVDKSKQGTKMHYNDSGYPMFKEPGDTGALLPLLKNDKGKWVPVPYIPLIPIGTSALYKRKDRHCRVTRGFVIRDHFKMNDDKYELTDAFGNQFYCTPSEFKIIMSPKLPKLDDESTQRALARLGVTFDGGNTVQRTKITKLQEKSRRMQYPPFPPKTVNAFDDADKWFHNHGDVTERGTPQYVWDAVGKQWTVALAHPVSTEMRGVKFIFDALVNNGLFGKRPKSADKPTTEKTIPPPRVYSEHERPIPVQCTGRHLVVVSLGPRWRMGALG